MSPVITSLRAEVRISSPAPRQDLAYQRLHRMGSHRPRAARRFGGGLVRQRESGRPDLQTVADDYPPLGALFDGERVVEARCALSRRMHEVQGGPNRNPTVAPDYEFTFLRLVAISEAGLSCDFVVAPAEDSTVLAGVVVIPRAAASMARLGDRPSRETVRPTTRTARPAAVRCIVSGHVSPLPPDRSMRLAP